MYRKSVSRNIKAKISKANDKVQLLEVKAPPETREEKVNKIIKKAEKVIPYNDARQLFKDIIGKKKDEYDENFLTYLDSKVTLESIDLTDEMLLVCDIHWLVLIKYPVFLQYIKARGRLNAFFYDDDRKRVWQYIKSLAE